MQTAKLARMQSGALSQAKTKSSWETCRDIVETDGFWALWSGLDTGLMLTTNPAITFFV